MKVRTLKFVARTVDRSCNNTFLFVCFFRSEIENQVRELQSKKAAASRDNEDAEGRIPMSASTGIMDQAIYGSSAKDKFADYVTSIATNDDDNDDDDDGDILTRNGTGFGKRINVNAPQSLINDVVDEDHDPMAGNRVPRIIDRLDEYRARGLKRTISPDRADPFLEGNYHCLYHLATV